MQNLSTDNSYRKRAISRLICALILPTMAWALARANDTSRPGFLPGRRVVPDAHNCYPYNGQWKDRIDRALSGGLPVAIEQDLHWYMPKDGSPPRSVVAHVAPLSGNEPSMEQYFFERIRPIVESALANPDHSKWPLITLNLDFKTEQPEHLRAIRALLQAHQSWLTTAPKTDTDARQELTVGPILVLNGPSDVQQHVFYDELPVGSRLMTFGAVHTNEKNLFAAPSVIETETATNYRRWWNNPWEVIEPEGQKKAGAWTRQTNDRLKQFVSQAHQRNLWIRFYTLDGTSRDELIANGWSGHSNFRSPGAMEDRWKACIEAGVDFIATDEYELLAQMVRSTRKS